MSWAAYQWCASSAAAATRRTCWVRSGRTSILAIRVSRRVGGSCPPRPAAAAATSSSLKNGLPWARSKTSSTSSAPGGSPRMPVSWAISSGRSKRWSSTRSTQGMPAVQLVGAVGEHQQQTGAAQSADQEAEQVAGGLVGPVQVLHHQDCGPLGGDPLHQVEQELE